MRWQTTVGLPTIKWAGDGSIDLGDREGTEADTERLMSTFKELKFNVLVYKDMTSYDMKKVLQVAAMQDHSAYDSIVVFILSHGGPNDVVYGCNGVSVRIKDLMSLFTSNKCPTLKSKPKMFFIQACRQPGTGEEHPYWGLDSPSISFGNKQIPDAAPVENTTSYDWADFLVGHSTFPGCQSFRDPNPAKGSYYITKLVQSLIKYHTEHHLLDILLIVNNEVATESDIQIPAPTFSLTKKVYLL
ncbi:caspase-8-like [Glandiceps talaboti]